MSEKVVVVGEDGTFKFIFVIFFKLCYFLSLMDPHLLCARST